MRIVMSDEHEIELKTLQLFSKIAKAVSPPPRLTVSQWADRYRKIPPESAAEPGQWNTDRAPYQREIMDAVNDPLVEDTIIMSSAQVGKTEIILNIIGYYIDYDPAPMLVVQPDVTPMGMAFSKDRLAPMIRDTPTLTKKSVTQSQKLLETQYFTKHSLEDILQSLEQTPQQILLQDL